MKKSILIIGAVVILILAIMFSAGVFSTTGGSCDYVPVKLNDKTFTSAQEYIDEATKDLSPEDTNSFNQAFQLEKHKVENGIFKLCIITGGLQEVN